MKELSEKDNDKFPENSKINEFQSEETLINESTEFPKVSFFKLQFFLADYVDYLFLFFSTIGSIIMGLTFPFFGLVFGDIMDNLSNPKINLIDSVEVLVLRLLWIALSAFAGLFLSIFFSSIVGNRMTKKIKIEYFKSLLRQDQSFFDKSNQFEYSTKMQSQIKTIRQGLGVRVSNILIAFTQFFAGYIIGFISSWKLSLCLLALIPFLSFTGYKKVNALIDSQSVSRKNYEEAGGIAEEVLYSIKTVAAFSNFDFERKRFAEKAEEAYEKGKYGGMISSIYKALYFLFIWGMFAMAIGIGAKFIYDDGNDENKTENFFLVGKVITVLFSIVFGSSAFSKTFPNINAVFDACDASREFFYIYEKKSSLDLSLSIKKPDRKLIEGQIIFDNVCFSYRNNPNKMIFSNLNISFEKRKITAIVGESGSGKSTIISLIGRIYDINSGNILIDGENIKNYNLEYLRSLIGYVQQEPTLLNISVKENIIFGRENVSDEEINEACEKAYLTEFLSKLNKGIETKTGLKGSKLSGGQKQRVAIARAILKKPKILILDEATSALDYRSEILIKKALDEISKSITTIIIAHRLSTVKNADKIIVMNKGQIAEVGNHEELFNKKGLYYNLVKNQENQVKENIGEVDNMIEDTEEKKIRDFQILDHNKNTVIEVENDTNKNNEVAVDQLKIESLIISYDNILNMPLEKQLESLNKNRLLLESDDIDMNEKNLIISIEQKVNEKHLESSKNALWELILQDKLLVGIATFFSIIEGCTWPILGFLLSEAIFKLTYNDKSELEVLLDNGKFISGMFVVLAGINAVSNFFVGNLFNLLGEKLAKNMRIMCYNKYLSFHVGFFDYNYNSPGSLLTKLSSDTLNINGMALSMFAILIDTIATLLLSLIIGFVYSWEITLICIAFLPFIILSSQIVSKMQKGMYNTNEIKEKEIGNLISETLISTKIIFSYNMQSKITEIFEGKIDEEDTSISPLIFSSLLNAFSQCLFFGIYIVTFYVGAVLLAKEGSNYTINNILKAIFSIAFGAFGVGLLQQYIGDLDRSRSSIISLNNILQMKSEIYPEERDSENDHNHVNINGNDDKNNQNAYISNNSKDELKLKKIKVDRNTFQPKIEFKNVGFHYPTRPEIKIFENLNFVINSGEKSAFVGFSGSGKSSIIQLILRFYDVQEGEILINGINIKEYDLSSLRKNIGYVMQEPVLFKRNVYHNIKYGCLEATKDIVIDSAIKARVNKINLITEESKDSLPVSGGEKQRIAIARCFIKDPKIILLDEATSALDKNTEEEVQQSLNNLTINRTSITIAHRLSTIIDSDKIFFLENGQIKESGNHYELLEKKGRYYELYFSTTNTNDDYSENRNEKENGNYKL